VLPCFTVKKIIENVRGLSLFLGCGPHRLSAYQEYRHQADSEVSLTVWKSAVRCKCGQQYPSLNAFGQHYRAKENLASAKIVKIEFNANLDLLGFLIL